MDTAILTLRGREDRREGETDVSRQKPAIYIRCQVLPMEDSQRQAQRKQHHRPFAEAEAVLGGDKCWWGGGRANREGECWQESSLVKEEVPGRYGCRPKSICMSVRFLEMELGRQENQFFYESHMIYNNNNTAGKLQKEPRKMPRLLHTGGRKHQQLRTDGIQEPENESPTMTWGQLHYVYNYVHTLWNSILSPTHSRHVHFNSISQPSHAGGGTPISKGDMKLVKARHVCGNLWQLVRLGAWLQTCPSPKQSCWLPPHPHPRTSTIIFTAGNRKVVWS